MKTTSLRVGVALAVMIGTALAVVAISLSYGNGKPKQPKDACQKALEEVPLQKTKDNVPFQKSLDNTPFCFKGKEANALYSLAQFEGKCQIDAVYDPTNWYRLTFRVLRAGKEILVLEGHSGSVFRADKDMLVFAHFGSSSSGCVVAAYDLDSGKQIWRTKLEDVGPGAHSAYRNEVTMDLSKNDGEGTITVTGHESYADYVEVLDKQTGTELAHRLYRQGYH